MHTKVPNVYTRFLTDARLDSSRFVEVWVYSVVDKDISLKPSREYIKIILDAAESFEFPKSYRDELQAWADEIE
jgi:hypothetical protein